MIALLILGILGIKIIVKMITESKIGRILVLFFIVVKIIRFWMSL